MADAQQNTVANKMSHDLLKKFILAEMNSGTEQDFSYMIEGGHGIGKSAIVKEIALLQKGFLIDLRLGQRDLGDVLGMPIIDTEVPAHPIFKHIKPELIRKAFVKDLNEIGLMGDDKDILAKDRLAEDVGKPYQFVFFFADEYNRGTKDVQQAMFELVYDRRMSGEKLNPKTWVFAACNDNMDVYTVTEGDPAFRSRFKTIKYSPTVEEWIKWGNETGELCEEVQYVITSKKDLADPPKGKDIDFLNNPHPNRRSWHHFSKFFVAHRNNFTENEMRDICATFIGGDAAEIFKLITKQMSELKKKRQTSVASEAKKTDEVWENYFKLNRWTKKDLEKELSTYNPSDLQAMSESLVDNFNKYKYMTSTAKEKVLEFSQVVNSEVFSYIWNSCNNTEAFKDKMTGFANSKGMANHFDQFKK